MNSISETAMVLAAGYGKRMQPLTLTKPKPLFEVGSRTMLDHALDKLVAAGIKRAVVNTFYLADQIEKHLATRKDIEIIISRETELLDTGGGIKKALSHFGGKPFFALNADLPWMDGKTASLTHMASSWDPKKMDALLLLMPTQKARGFDSAGDFAMAPDGRLSRQNVPTPRPYVMLSAQILKPESFKDRSEKVFSNKLIWNEAEAQKKLYGTTHEGACYHVGTPADLEKANQLLASGQGWRVP